MMRGSKQGGSEWVASYSSPWPSTASIIETEHTMVGNKASQRHRHRFHSFKTNPRHQNKLFAGKVAR